LFGVDDVAGLPVHVLVVHFAVVLVPLAAVGLIATGWQSGWRRRYALAIALIAIVGAVAAFVAAQSGPSLAHSVRRSAEASGQQVPLGEHPEEGDMAEVAAIVFAVAAAVFFGLDQWGDRIRVLGPKLERWLPLAAYVAASVPAAIALVTMIIAGHSGAALVWKDVGNFVPAS
jgi:hypothetical protein